VVQLNCSIARVSVCGVKISVIIVLDCGEIEQEGAGLQCHNSVCI
jgi:hypothetical protein